MRRVLLTLAGVGTVGLVVAALVVGLGLYNVSARVGHLPGVSWILHTTYRNAVELRAPPDSAVPPLTEEMAEIGARHFDSACRFCHSRPGEQRSATARSMVPAPPHVTDAVRHWEPRHLFWIVLNGVKMSGMPHWPAPRRRDEAWMMAAFLDRARTMTEAEYAALVAPVEHPDPLLARCAMCHGVDGAGRGNRQVPRLDIQGAPYLAASLRAYRDGLRHSGVMREAASGLAERDIERLAAHFGRQQPVGPGPAGDTGPAASGVTPGYALVAAGRAIAFGKPRGRATPACRACHGPWPAPRAPLFPTLVGQHGDYLRTQLTLWREDRRGGTERAHLMMEVAHRLEPDMLDAVAAFYAAGAPPD